MLKSRVTQNVYCLCYHFHLILMVEYVNRMLPVKLLLSYKVILTSSLETTVMGILLRLYWLIRWELHRFLSLFFLNLLCLSKCEISCYLLLTIHLKLILNVHMCSAPSRMHLRRQNIRIQIYIGRNLMINITFHASSLLI